MSEDVIGLTFQEAMLRVLNDEHTAYHNNLETIYPYKGMLTTEGNEIFVPQHHHLRSQGWITLPPQN